MNVQSSGQGVSISEAKGSSDRFGDLAWRRKGPERRLPAVRPSVASRSRRGHRRRGRAESRASPGRARLAGSAWCHPLPVAPLFSAFRHTSPGDMDIRQLRPELQWCIRGGATHTPLNLLSPAELREDWRAASIRRTSAAPTEGPGAGSADGAEAEDVTYEARKAVVAACC